MTDTIEILKRAKEVSRFAPLSTEEKNNAILKMADSLMENTDENHYVTVADIIEYLASKDINAERKSVYDGRPRSGQDLPFHLHRKGGIRKRILRGLRYCGERFCPL